MRWNLTRMASRNGLAARTVAVRGTILAKGKRETSIAIYQFKGNWLSAVYTSNSSAAQIRAAYQVAQIESRKLAAAVRDSGASA